MKENEELFWIDQGCSCVEIREINPDIHNRIREFLQENFKGFYRWEAFGHRFYISDSCKGRHKTIEMLKNLKSQLR